MWNRCKRRSSRGESANSSATRDDQCEPPPNGSSGGVERPAGSEVESDSARNVPEVKQELSEDDKRFDAFISLIHEELNTIKLQDEHLYMEEAPGFVLFIENSIKRHNERKLAEAARRR